MEWHLFRTISHYIIPRIVLAAAPILRKKNLLIDFFVIATTSLPLVHKSIKVNSKSTTNLLLEKKIYIRKRTFCERKAIKGAFSVPSTRPSTNRGVTVN